MDAIPTHPTTRPTGPTAQAAGTTLPVKFNATQSIHGDFLEKSVPTWLSDATTQRRQALKDVSTTLPSWYQDATPAQRSALTDTFIASVTAQNALDKSLEKLQQVEEFARPLLLNALKDQYQVQVDVDKTLLCLKRPVDVGVLKIELASFEFLKLSMLDAALHNFEAYECEEGAYHETSGFMVATQITDTFQSQNIGVTVSQFLRLCRSLDIGKQYQTYLKAFFFPADPVAENVLRARFNASQKATMRAAAEQALLQKDIEPADYTMILSVIAGEMHPWMGNKQVWFEDLGVMKKRLTGCVAFVICEKYRYSDELILYIPHDPHHPLKRYTHEQMRSEFKRLLTARDATEATGAAPTGYQQFLSQFLPYDQRPYYFSQFTQKAADSPRDVWQVWRSPWAAIIVAISPGSAFTKLSEVPPERKVKLEPVADPYIAPSTVGRKGRGLWAANDDLWEYLFTQSREKTIADARSHAVPTAEVDAKARDAKLAHLMQIGLLGLNMVSMFVPVLGEVMMVVMAGQLLYEALEGAIEWSEGDRRAAKDHLIDVAENLALIGFMSGVGAAAQKFSAARTVPVIERLSPITLPNGQTRLWKPDLSAYESSIILDASLGPNSAGQYMVDGNTYIRLDGKLYQQTYDQAINKWRLQHPTDASAYQPVLESNGAGAWRSTLEQPLTWDRLTLLRRMGHRSEAFSDAELIKAADISGVSDDALRKMHLDHASAPPQLLQAMRMLKADTDAGRVIEQLRGTQAVDEMYLYALPLITEMPLWPANRVLEVFDGAGLSGKSVKYGGGRRVRGSRVRAPIQISRSDILLGDLPAIILAALDDAETTRLLGEQGARVRESRPAEFARQIADYAQTRQSAIYDSIYKGTEPADPLVKRLQTACPGLTESAAQDVLAHASADDRELLTTTGRAPLRVLEQARWYARQSRQVRAYAGLRSENIASTDSRRLALHTLEELPGWPADLRLEVREGNPEGPLLDSVGAETAGEKKYLIKKGAQFQAFDDRGEALNSLPRNGDNFYASIMHALPDEARRSLGLPAVGQSAGLQ
ncbi:dermonecrotic toxin domain-containing protein [Pseudomonas triticicola]|uniref:dermonecrotic toxin domain-containing protein n=1 Tax=Pseudomonas triticicola TaxID=2842345 RepID=UPI003EBFE25F